MFDRTAFSRRLDTILKKYGDQSELARQTGISDSLLSQYRNDRAAPSVGNLCILAQALGVSVNWLLAGIGPPHVTDDEWRLLDGVQRLNPERRDLVKTVVDSLLGAEKTATGLFKLDKEF